MNQPYRPLACSLHDELEALATLRRACRIEFYDEHGAVAVIDAVIVDIFARGNEEFMRLENGRLIRLDKILRLNEKQFQQPCDLN